MAHEDHRQYRAALLALRDSIDRERERGVQRTPEQRADDQRIRDESDREARIYMERMSEIVTVGTGSLGMTPGQFQLKDTAIIEYVAEELPPDTDLWVRRSLGLFWHTGSGYSHSLRWPALLDTKQVSDAGAGIANVRVHASPQDLCTAIVGPVVLVGQALDKYRRQTQPQY